MGVKIWMLALPALWSFISTSASAHILGLNGTNTTTTLPATSRSPTSISLPATGNTSTSLVSSSRNFTSIAATFSTTASRTGNATTSLISTSGNFTSFPTTSRNGSHTGNATTSFVPTAGNRTSASPTFSTTGSPTGSPFNDTLPPDEVHDICSGWDSTYGTNNAAIWSNSLADKFLNDFLVAYGPATNGGWLNNMDELTTGSGDEASVMTDCHIIGGSCPLPEISCDDFTPTAYYFIRRAANGVNTVLTATYNNLVADTITQSLDLTQMVNDFSAQVVKAQRQTLCPKNIFANVQAAVGVVGGIVGSAGSLTENPYIGAASGFFGALGGILGFAVNNEPDCPVPDLTDIESSVTSALSSYFQHGRDYYTNLLEAVIQGDNSIYPLPGTSSSSNDPTMSLPITQFFYNGIWLLPSADSDWDQFAQGTLDSTSVYLKQTMVNTVLKTTNIFIWHNTDITSEDDCSAFDGGARWQNNNCYVLVEDKCGTIPHDSINKLDAYNVTIDDVYSYSIDCLAAFPNGDGVPQSTFFGKYPRCFYNLLAVSSGKNPSMACIADDSPCNVIVSDPSSPWNDWCKLQCRCDSTSPLCVDGFDC